MLRLPLLQWATSNSGRPGRADAVGAALATAGSAGETAGRARDGRRARRGRSRRKTRCIVMSRNASHARRRTSGVIHRAGCPRQASVGERSLVRLPIEPDSRRPRQPAVPGRRARNGDDPRPLADHRVDAADTPGWWLPLRVLGWLLIVAAAPVLLASSPGSR